MLSGRAGRAQTAEVAFRLGGGMLAGDDREDRNGRLFADFLPQARFIKSPDIARNGERAKSAAALRASDPLGDAPRARAPLERQC